MADLRRLLPKKPDILFLVAVPWFLLVLNSNWPFANGGNCDPWFYYGHFRTYPEVFLAKPSYDGERLAVVLPGYLLHRILQPVAAQIVLHLGFYYVAVFSLYYITRSIHGPKTALLTAGLLATHSFFLGAIGWDYGDGFGVAYHLLALALLTRASRYGQTGLWLALAGAASAALVYTHPLWALFLPFFPLYYMVSAKVQQRASIGRAAAGYAFYSLLGVAGLSLCFAALSYRVAGTLNFYAWSIHLLRIAHTLAEWKSYDLTWLPSASWLVFPTLTFVGCLIFLVRNGFPKHDSREVIAALFVINFLYCFLAFAFLTFIGGRRLLEYEYYTSSLLPPMFLCLAFTYLSVPETARAGTVAVVVPLVMLVSVCPLWKPTFIMPQMLFPLKAVQTRPDVLHYYLLLPLLIALGGTLLRLCLPSARGMWAICVSALCVAGFGLVPFNTRGPYFASYHGPSLYSRVALAMDLIRTQTAGSPYRFFWFAPTESAYLDFLAITRSLREHHAVDLSFPDLAAETNLPAEAVLIIFAERKELPLAAQRALCKKGLRGTLLSQVKIAKGEATYWITFMRATRAHSTASTVDRAINERGVCVDTD
jgi:hypothetical protein